MKSHATNPTQYDSLNWASAGAEDNPSRKWFRDALDRLIPKDALTNKRIVDVGCGVGQLFNWLKARGAAEVSGFDPSGENVSAALYLYPWAHVLQATLHEFATTRTAQFDAATVVMTLEYTPDIHQAFEELASLLIDGGDLYVIVGDHDYFTSSELSIRGTTVVGVEVLQQNADGGTEVKTLRNEPGVGPTAMYEIFRPISLVREAAKDAGFNITNEKPMPGPPLSNGHPTTVCHTLALKK